MAHAELIRDWHPLDRGSPPDYIPPAWDGPHVGKRLVEALRTLATMPYTNGPREFGGAWPDISHMFDGDQLAWLSEDPRTGLKPDRPPLQMMKLRPTSEAITRMETGLGWPGLYLAPFPQLVRAVTAVAAGRARFREIDVTARRVGLPARTLRRWNRDGLDQIASGLRVDAVAVF
jgi:hypothetical protein